MPDTPTPDPADDARSDRTKFWTVGFGLFATFWAVSTGFLASEHHSTLLWAMSALGVVAALVSFTGVLVKWRRNTDRRGNQ